MAATGMVVKGEAAVSVEQLIATGSTPAPVAVRGIVISEVSRLLGVPMPTLRSWEVRYGIPSSAHVKGRHRRYSPVELHTLRLMHDEIARGRRAAAAAQTVRRLLDPPESAAAFIARLLSAAARLDGLAVQEVLDDAGATLGLTHCVDQVLLPGLRQVGTWWAAGRCDAGPERLVTQAARGWLYRHRSTGGHHEAGSVVLACGPRDAHTVGLEAFAAVLATHGWDCHVLGARTGPAALTTAVDEIAPAAVVVVSHLSSGRRGAIDCLTAAKQAGATTFYAGNAFTGHRRSPTPGTYLGDNLGAAAALLTTALTNSRAAAPSVRPARMMSVPA